MKSIHLVKNIIGCFLVMLMGNGVMWAQVPEVLKTAEQCSVNGVKVVQGRIVPAVSRSNAAAANQTARLRSLLERKIREETLTHLPYVKTTVSSVGTSTGFLLYRKTLQDFEALRKQLNPLLFYQSNPQERRVLSPVEKRYLLEQIDVVKKDLVHVYNYVEPTEPALTTVQEYVDESLRLLIPEIARLPLTKPLPRQDRDFNIAEFFLRDPELHFWQKFSWQNLATSSLKSIHVAIINDDSAIRYALWHAHENKHFLPEGQLKVYDNGEDLIKDIERNGKFPNVVLTDLSLTYSSGYLVAEELRSHGYKGPIIGFSAFMENEDIGREMFDYGLDGLISVSKVFYKVPFWYHRVHRKLANYFYYQQLHGWKR